MSVSGALLKGEDQDARKLYKIREDWSKQEAT